MKDWIIVIITLIASAFFSGMEIAFISSNKLRIELESKKGKLSSRVFSHFNQQPSRYLGSMLLGNTISLVIFGIFMQSILDPVIRRYITAPAGVLIIQTVISTSFILVTAEFLPKNFFRVNPNRILNIFAVPAWLIYHLLLPLVWITIGLAEFFLNKVLGVEKQADKVVFGRVDLDHFVNEELSSYGDQKEEIEHEVQIFRNALDFSSVKARECMIPRTELVAMDVNQPIDELKKSFLETGLSKILIYEGSIDNIIGYAHSYELFKRPDTIRAILLPISIVPESMPASEILTIFIQQHKSIAVVVDEFGGTSGILTMEDVIEEIFGEIEDEHDKEEMTERKINENEFIFSGRLEIDYLNEKYNLNLPESEEYETLAGLIIHYKESIPKLNERIRLEQFVFRITDVSETRIEQVHLAINTEKE